MTPYELRDFLLSLPWLYISAFVLFWIVVILLVRKGDDGQAVLIGWALRIVDFFYPNRPAAKERARAREMSYWMRKDGDK